MSLVTSDSFTNATGTILHSVIDCSDGLIAWPIVLYIQIYHLYHEGVVHNLLTFNDGQQAEGPNCSFSAASKGCTQSQPRNKGLI